MSATSRPVPSARDLTAVGTTDGLARTCDREGPRVEQVYVYTVDGDPSESHPVVVHGWVGYSIPSGMMLTRSQAAELIGLLAKAIQCPPT